MYAANADAPEHHQCRHRLEQWRASSDAWFVTWGICYEFLRVVTHPKVLRRPWTGPEAWRFVELVLASPGATVLVPTSRHLGIAAEVIRGTPQLAGNLAHDAHTAALMREHGIRRIYTRDTDFHRFPFLEPIDPLA